MRNCSSLSFLQIASPLLVTAGCGALRTDMREARELKGLASDEPHSLRKRPSSS
jgi:hypothetical protein